MAEVGTPKAVRCAVYTRKSSEEGLEQSFNSLHAQREACEAYVLSQKHEGWQLLPTPYDDGGFSGGSMERPGLQALLADVAAGKVDIIVVYKVDRLTRSLADFAKMVERFDANGTSFVSVTQAFNTTTSMGRLTLNVLLSFAQFEREVTGERIRDKIAASKAKGMWMGGLAPLGYDVQDRALVVNPVEAKRVRKLFELYAELKTVDAVVAKAAALGFRSKPRTSADGSIAGDQPLTRGSLYRILANPLYVGEMPHGKLKRYPGLHKAIVPPALFDEVQALLEANRHKRKVGRAKVPALLSGLVLDEAGVRLTATHTGKGAKRYCYYANDERRIPAAELEALVRSLVCDTLGDRTQLAKLLLNHATVTPEAMTSGKELARQLKRATALDARTLAVDLIERVTIRETQVEVGIRLAALGCAEGAIATLSAAATLGKRKARLSLVVPGAVAPTPDATLIAMVARGRRWFEDLVQHRMQSVAEIAAAASVNESYVRRLISTAFLAPDLVTAIVEGRQPPALTAASLRTLLPLPADWAEQRAAVARLG